jgi:hypothetical protein
MHGKDLYWRRHARRHLKMLRGCTDAFARAAGMRCYRRRLAVKP